MADLAPGHRCSGSLFQGGWEYFLIHLISKGFIIKYNVLYLFIKGFKKAKELGGLE